MHFDEWFDYQSKMVKVILLFIPVVGWIVEILVRISATIKKHCQTNVVGLIVFTIIGWGWMPTIIDLLYVAFTDHLMFVVVDEE